MSLADNGVTRSVHTDAPNICRDEDTEAAAPSSARRERAETSPGPAKRAEQEHIAGCLTEKQKCEGGLHGLFSGSLKKRIDILLSQVAALDEAVVATQERLSEVAVAVDRKVTVLFEDMRGEVAKTAEDVESVRRVAHGRAEALDRSILEGRDEMRSLRELQDDMAKQMRQHESEAKAALEIATANQHAAATSCVREASNHAAEQVEAARQGAREQIMAAQQETNVRFERLEEAGRRQAEELACVRGEFQIFSDRHVEEHAATEEVLQRKVGGFSRDLAQLEVKLVTLQSHVDAQEAESENDDDSRPRRESSSSASRIAVLLARDKEADAILQQKVDLLIKSMADKADADEIAGLRHTFNDVQEGVDECKATLREHSHISEDVKKVLGIADDVERRVMTLSEKLNHLAEALHTKAGPEYVKQITEEIVRFQKQVTVLQKNVQERVSVKHMQAFGEAVDLLRQQVCKIEKMVHSKADAALLRSHDDTLSSLKRELSCLAEAQHPAEAEEPLLLPPTPPSTLGRSRSSTSRTPAQRNDRKK
eukprot:TRINITY_DN25493_c0_g1_i1.p1 TRINITY_DN25493_c0_g1~~TRINITY_DN25493_c0_g1_i1.p1  ORF type:complete len:539 (-),score=147.56 TRINITY_DN25493_c0_g1_i1:178-1794(-)